MKTNLITIALTALITLNVNAATFLFQAHTPSGVVVMEGNKGSETPVVQQPAQPTPTSNWIQSNYDSKFGYYENMTCYGQVGNHYENNTMGGFFMLYKNGYEADYNVIKVGVDSNNNSYMYADQNNNNVHDNGEQSYYIGNSFINTDAQYVDGEGNQITVQVAQVCGYDMVDSPIINQPIVEGWNESEFSTHYPEFQNYGWYDSMTCNSSNTAKLALDQDGLAILFDQNFDHITFNGEILDTNKVYFLVDGNFKSYFLYDANGNYEIDYQPDATDLKIYINNMTSSYQAIIHGESRTVQEYTICTE